MNQQYDHNPLKGISIQEAVYLSESSDPVVRQNAQNILFLYQQSMENNRKCEEQNKINNLPTQSQLSGSGDEESLKIKK